ncbi:MAG: hypothetical protein ABI968_07340 [Acidobacteriota bacterium]
MVKMSTLAGLAALALASCFAPAVEPQKSKSSTQKAKSTVTDTGQHFFVSPSGDPAGNGSMDAPWDLPTALSHPAAVQPGDTIWLRGGAYVGTFTSVLTGTPASPIKLRQHPGERAILDGNAITTLSVAIDASATSCTLAAGPFTQGTVARMDSEDVLLFIRTGSNKYTIERGWNGTTPAMHPEGTAVTTRNTTLVINGANTWYMDFEVMNSSGLRSHSIPGSIPPPGLGFGIDANGPGTRIINMVIHDAGQGIGIWTPAGDSEVYGNLIYYNGWDAPDRGHGHGVYVQNEAPSVKRIVDNILFDQFGIGSQAYSEQGNIDNIYLEGNTAFQNGILSQVSGYTYNLLIGGKPVAASPSVISNFTYGPASAGGSNNLGYSGGCTNATVTGNYFAQSSALDLVNCFSGLTLTENTFYGSTNGFIQFQLPLNSYYSSRPTGTQVFVRPNQYEAGRANITVYNWDLLNTVGVDVSGILEIGDRYEVRNGQNFFATPVLAGTYAGGTLALPMTGLSVATPVGHVPPGLTGPEFNVFVLLKTGSARQNVHPVPRSEVPRLLPIHSPRPPASNAP